MRPQSFLLVVACASLFGCPANAAEPVRREGWLLNNLEAAQTEARKTGKPIFVVIRCEA